MKLAWALALLLGAEPAPVAQVTYVSGSVTIVRQGTQIPAPLNTGDTLQRGDRVAAAPGADAGLLVGGVLRKLSSLPDARWTAGDPFDRASAPPPTSRPGGVDFARREALEKAVAAKGVLAILAPPPASSRSAPPAPNS